MSVLLTENWKMLQDSKLEMYQVVWMDQVLSCLPYERALIATCTGVTLHGVATSADKVIEPRELDNQCIPINLVERSFLEVVLYKRCLQCATGLFLM